MDAVEDFAVALGEVDCLVAMSRKTGVGDSERSVLVKASLLLLAAKTECFIEDIVEEYCTMEGKKVTSAEVSEAVRISVSRKRLIDSEFVKNESLERDKALKVLSEVAALWCDTRPCPQLEIDAKFDFGRHGEEEVRRLFRRIGMEGVFDRCLVEDNIESMASSQGPISVAADFNSLTHLRNNIIHTDATPSLTDSDVERYKRRLMLFAREVERQLLLNLRTAAA